MAFRLFSKLDTLLGNTLQGLPGGQLRFYDAGTTTPAAVYGDEELTVNNGVTVTLDSSSRPNVDVWGAASASYFVELYDAGGVKQGEADDVQDPAGASSNIPSLSGNTGKFLTNNGAVTLWATIREVPDPTGQSGKVLGNDGTNLAWQAAPATPVLPTGGVTEAAGRLQIGSTQILHGTATAAASGNTPASQSVTFATAFDTTPRVVVTAVVTAISPSGFLPAVGTTVTTTGFTAKFDNNSGYNQAGENINAAIPFDWIAIGTKAP